MRILRAAGSTSSTAATRRVDVVFVAHTDWTGFDELERAAQAVIGGARLLTGSYVRAYAGANGPILSRGAMVTAAIAKASGARPVVVGKPSRPAVREYARRLGVAPAEAAVVGDDLHLDIALGPARRLLDGARPDRHQRRSRPCGSPGGSPAPPDRLDRDGAAAMAVTRALVIPEPGGPEVLRLAEREVRDPGAGEVRVAVRAAAVNPTDIGLRQRGAEGIEPPWVPGMDAAGVVESVGAGVARLAPGDEVMAAVMPRRPEGGAQAELVVVPAASVVAVPDGTTLEQAATLPMNGLTALRGLELLDLAPGQTLAVTGGAGLLASYVIPLAKRRGLRVFADAKLEDEELVRGFGADELLPRGDGLVEALRALAPRGVDAVYDTALLGRSMFPAIRPGGALAYVRGWDGDDVEAASTYGVSGSATCRADRLAGRTA